MSITSIACNQIWVIYLLQHCPSYHDSDQSSSMAFEIHRWTFQWSSSLKKENKFRLDFQVQKIKFDGVFDNYPIELLIDSFQLLMKCLILRELFIDYSYHRETCKFRNFRRIPLMGSFPGNVLAISKQSHFKKILYLF